MNNNLYAFDLSLSCTGITIFDLKTVSPIKIMSVQTRDKDSYGVRLKSIADEILLLKQLYYPEKIVIERGFSRFNSATQSIFRVHGLVNYIFHDLEQIYYPPKKIKEAIIRGDASKKFVRQMIEAKYPDVKFDNEDESDSFAVALTYLIKNKLIQWDKDEIKKKLK